MNAKWGSLGHQRRDCLECVTCAGNAGLLVPAATSRLAPTRTLQTLTASGLPTGAGAEAEFPSVSIQNEHTYLASYGSRPGFQPANNPLPITGEIQNESDQREVSL